MAAGTASRAESQAKPGVGITPASLTATPSAARPAARAAWSKGLERRVSLPVRKRVAPRTRATTRARASSGVSSALATPRTPSVPNRRGAGPVIGETLALRVLGGLAGLLQPVLLALLLPGVPGEEAGPLERLAQVGVQLGQSPRYAQAQGAGLAGDPPAIDAGLHVVGVGVARYPQGLGGDHPVGGRREVGLEGPAVDHDGPRAGTQPHPGHGRLAPAGYLGQGLAPGGGGNG